MTRLIWIFGLVLGTILCVNMVYMVNLVYNHPGFKSSDVLGYAAMVVIFSLIFFGVRNYRNRHNGGVITFGKAFKTGFFIALIASTMYVVTWLFYYYLFVPDFIDRYTTHVITVTSPEKLEAKMAEMAKFKEMYKNPLFVIIMTYAEVLPVGLIVSLISALILKKKPEIGSLQQNL